MKAYGQLLHFPSSFHPSFPPSVCSVAWLQLWTAKTFLFSAERRKLIIYMFQSVLKSECNLPPLPPPSFILSLIHRSQHQLWGMFLNCSPHLTFTVAIFVFFFMLDIKMHWFWISLCPKAKLIFIGETLNSDHKIRCSRHIYILCKAVFLIVIKIIIGF